MNRYGENRRNSFGRMPSRQPALTSRLLSVPCSYSPEFLCSEGCKEFGNVTRSEGLRVN